MKLRGACLILHVHQLTASQEHQEALWRIFLIGRLLNLGNFCFLNDIQCLWNILPDEYFQHFILLVEAIWLLDHISESPECLQKAHNLLRHFCLRTDALYGSRYEAFNVHCLLHLNDCVKNIGPLWACFAFGKKTTMVTWEDCFMVQTKWKCRLHFLYNTRFGYLYLYYHMVQLPKNFMSTWHRHGTLQSVNVKRYLMFLHLV